MVNSSVDSHKRKQYEDSLDSEIYTPPNKKKKEPPESPVISLIKGFGSAIAKSFLDYFSSPPKKTHKHNHHIRAKARMSTSHPSKSPKFNRNSTHNVNEQKYPVFNPAETQSELKYPSLYPEVPPETPPQAPLHAYDGLQSFIEIPDSPPRRQSNATPPVTSLTPSYSSTSPPTRSSKNEYPQPSTTTSYLDEIDKRADADKLTSKLQHIVLNDVTQARTPAPLLPSFLSSLPPSAPSPLPASLPPPSPAPSSTRLFRSASALVLATPPVNKNARRKSAEVSIILLDEDEDTPFKYVPKNLRTNRKVSVRDVLRHQQVADNYQQYLQSENLTKALDTVQALRQKTKEEYNKLVEQRLKQITEQKVASAAKDELPALTPEQQKRIAEVLSRRGNEGEVIVEGFNVELKREDIWCLNPGEWLNDEVINFYINLLMERNKKSSPVKTYIFNSHFYSLLYYNTHKYDYARVRRWTSKIGEDVFKLDKIIVPIHLGMHWCLAVINFKMKRFEYYDSLLGSNDECLNVLRRWVQDEAKKSNKTIDLSDWTNYTPKDIPMQRNGYDCGVFMLRFAERASRDSSFNFSQESMPAVRKLMVHEIINKKAH